MNSAALRVSDVLRLRIQSALVLIVAAEAAVWFGSPWVALIVAFAGLAMGWGRGRLTAGGEFGARAAIAMATALLAVGIAASGRFVPALIVAVVGGIAMAAARARDRVLSALGTAWIAGGCIAFLWLADPRIGGRVTIFFLLLIVWLTDIFRLFCRTVGRRPQACRCPQPEQDLGRVCRRVDGCGDRRRAHLSGNRLALWRRHCYRSRFEPDRASRRLG